MKTIFEPLARGDYKTTASTIIFTHPREAVQLILLSFRHHAEGSEKFAIDLLRSLPALPRPIRAAMFGPKATFYADNKVSYKLADQVSMGVGAQADPTTAFEGLSAAELSELPPDQVLALLFAAVQGLRTRDNLIAKLAAGGVHAAPGMAERPRASENDPKGYCAVLGIDPSILQNYGPEELTIIINNAFRSMARIWHPDYATEGDTADINRRTAQQERLNEARDNLLNSNFRKNYGKPRQ